MSHSKSLQTRRRKQKATKNLAKLAKRAKKLRNSQGKGAKV